MEKSIKRITNIILIALTLLAVIASIIIPFTGEESASRELTMNMGAIGMYILAIIAIMLIVVFAVTQVASNKKQLFRTLLLLAGVAVIVLISYFLASSDLNEKTNVAAEHPEKVAEMEKLLDQAHTKSDIFPFRYSN